MSGFIRCPHCSGRIVENSEYELTWLTECDICRKEYCPNYSLDPRVDGLSVSTRLRGEPVVSYRNVCDECKAESEQAVKDAMQALVDKHKVTA